MEINILKLSLNIESDINESDAEKIRGYLGSVFWDNPHVHHHKENGSLIYRYPRVQYKVIDGSCVLIGFNEGLDIVKKIFDDLKYINLDGRWHCILSKSLESYKSFFGLSLDQQSYYFLTPWLALNHKNYEKYMKSGSWLKRKKLLESIIIGNLISMSKNLGYTVSAQVKADINSAKEIRTYFKGTPVLGFLGTFSVNFEIPDYWGIGKSVSRGYGTIKRLYEKELKNAR